MASPTELLELGERYWALGLPAAARSALGRALAASSDAAPALRLTDIALAQGDVQGARGFAAEAAKRAPGPAAKILLGRAQLAAGELAAARMSLLAALDSPKLVPWDRARAHLELSRAAQGQSDGAGAAAQAGAAFEAALAAARKEAGGDVDVIAIVEEICAVVVTNGRGADANETADKEIAANAEAHAQLAIGDGAARDGATRDGASRDSDKALRERACDPRGLLLVRAILLGARQAAGEGGISDHAIDEALAQIDGSGHNTGADHGAGVGRGAGAGAATATSAGAASTPTDVATGAAAGAPATAAAAKSTPTNASTRDAGRSGGTALSLRRLERRARKHAVAERTQLLGELAQLIQIAAGEPLAPADRARLHFLYASLCADDSAAASRAQAEDAYRKGLAFQPGHVGAACRLALLVLDRGDQPGALAEIERALRIDASHGLAWRSAARMIDAQSLGVGAIVGRLLDAANPGAGSVAGGAPSRLVTATAEVARHDVLAGVYAHGHRVKNLLGIIGARTRSARKLAEGDVQERLKDLEKDVTALYEEWAQYLRSMQAPTPTIELVPLSALLHEVVGAAQARTHHVPIQLEAQSHLPDVRGDRMLLREAVLNVVSNAAEACGAAGGVDGASGGTVHVRARAIAFGSGEPHGAAPIVEIVVADTGPGIPRAHLGRLFVPGFTTKETGSGVGLAIAERVVAAHHGRITVESEEGRGTTITITLPTDKTGLLALPVWAAERGVL